MHIKIKQLIFGAVFLVSVNETLGQTDAHYYNTNAYIGSYSEISTGTGGETIDIDTNPSSELDLGFELDYFNSTYTTFSANKHGWATLGRTASQAGAGLSDSNNDLDDPNTGLVIAPLWDFFSDANDFTIQREGTEPERVFIAQWKDMTWPVTASNANISFQVRIYEAGDSIQFIYDTDGTVDTDATRNASVGISTDEMIDNRLWSLESFVDGSIQFSFTESDDLSTLPIDNQVLSFAPGNIFTEQTDLVFDGTSFGDLEWADVDNDDDLDFILTGLTQTGLRVSKIYENKISTGEGFPNYSGVNLDAVQESESAWGDMDNDGDLDLLLTGQNNSGVRVSRIYENRINTASDFLLRTDISVTGVAESSAAWFDMDTDGDLDFVISGRDPSFNRRMMVYENQLNEGSTFSLTHELEGIYDGQLVVGDMDNDGDPDLIASGLTTTRRTIVYENRINTDEGFVERTDISLDNVNESALAFGDIDSDEDLDLILTGFTGSIRTSQIYLNQFNESGTFTNSGFSIQNVNASAVDWGDMDNDGDLDLLLNGFDGANRQTLVYENQIADGNGFIESDLGLDPLSEGDVEWGDYDGDGDLDLIISGQGDVLRVTKLYANNLNNSYPTPGIPINLQAQKVTDESKVLLTWDKPLNDTIYTYSLKIGTDSMGIDVRAPQSNLEIGYRKIPERGKVQQNSYTVENFPSGTYFWSVQAINNGFGSSEFSNVIGFDFGPPDAPVNVGEAESPAGDENFYISWEPAARATSYVYFIGQDTTDQGVLTDFVENQVNISVEDTFAAVTLPEQKKYFYNVRAVNDFGQSDLSNVSTFDFATTSLSIYKNDSAFVKDQILFFNSADSALMSWGATYLRGSPVYETVLIDCSIPPESVFSEVRLYLSEDSLYSVDDTPLDTAIFESNQIKFQDIPNDIIPDSSYVFVRGDILENPNDTRFFLSIDPSSIIISGATLNDFELIESSNYLAKPYNFVEADLSGISAFHTGGMSVADIDNDGDHDIAISGTDASGNLRTSIFENQMAEGNGFVTLSDPVTSIGGSVTWSDFDNDNDMDLFIVGSSSTSANAVVIENRVNVDGTFQSLGGFFGQITDGETFLGDFDNDGDNDVVISGLNSSGFASTQYYENDWVENGTFIDRTATVGGLINVSSSSVDGADVDLDGDLDLIVAGVNGTVGQATIFINQLDENGTFVQLQTLSTLTSNLTVSFGQYDEDGYPDLMITGSNATDSLAIIYSNDLSTGTEFIEDFSFEIRALGAMDHVDFDHDGDPDLIATGTERTQLFENRLDIGEGFQEINIDLEDLSNSDAVWIDVDADMDYDLILAGVDTSGTVVVKGFEGINIIDNQTPSTPENIESFLNTENSQFILRWDHAQDDNTPEDLLTYNIFIGTSELDDNIKPAEADLSNGFLLNVREGSVQDTSWIVRNLPTDVYYWAVQSVDQAQVASPFSQVGSFPFGTPAVPEVFTIIEDFAVNWTRSARADNYLLSVGTDTLATGELDMSTLITGFDELQVSDTTAIIDHSQKVTLFYVVQAINDFGSSGLSDVGIIEFNPELIKVELNELSDDFNVLVYEASDVPVLSLKVSVATDNLVFDSLRLVANDTLTEVMHQAKLVKSDSEVYDASATELISLGTFANDSLIFPNFQDVLSFGDSYYYVLNSILDDPQNDSLHYNIAQNDVIFEAGESNLNEDLKSDTFLLQRFIYLPFDTTRFSGLSGYSEWADVDNDGDQDLALSTTDEFSIPQTQLYLNDNGNLTAVDTLLTNILGPLTWADFDNDGDVDLLISGLDETGSRQAIIFENRIAESEGFMAQDLDITATSAGSVATSDFDNDGDVDFAIAGSTGSSSETSVYENQLNEGGGFVRIAVGFAAITTGEVTWADMDKDGDDDLLVTGIFGTTQTMSVYQNQWIENSTFVLRNDVSLSGAAVTADWGDVDGDGDLDLVTSGSVATRIYTNTSSGNISFTEMVGTPFGPFEDGDVKFVDADNDGDLDLILSGENGSGDKVTEVYVNEAANFTIQAINSIAGAHSSDISLVDIDGDTDLDLLISGLNGNEDPISYLHLNDLNFSNTNPEEPSNLTVEVDNDVVTFSWDDGSDNETVDESLNYSMYLGSTENRYIDVTSPSTLISGDRLVTRRGNIQDTSAVYNNVAPGIYFWSVQSVDAAYAGSEFASEETFTIQDTIAVSPLSEQNDVIYYSETNSVLDFKAIPLGRSAIIDNVIVAYTGTVGLIENALLVASEDSLLDTESDNTFIGDAVAIENDSIRFEPNFLLRADTNHIFVTIKVVDFDGQSDDNLSFRLTSNEFYTQNSVVEDFDINNSVNVLVSEQTISATLDNPVVRGFEDQELASLHVKSVGGFTLDSIAYTLGVTASDVFEEMSMIKSVDSLLSTSDDNTELTATIDLNSQFVSASDIQDTGLQDSASYILIGKVRQDVSVSEFTIQLNRSDVFINGGVVSGSDVLIDSTITIVNNVFVENSDVNLQGLEDSSIALGDIDNDGDLDVLIAGWSGSNEIFDIYENQFNEGGSLLKRIDLQITGLNFSSIDLGDYDNDGDLDILASGESGFGVLETRIFVNNLNSTTSFDEDANVQLTDVKSGSLQWGDMDNDGDLDILLTGNRSSNGVSWTTEVYENLLPENSGFSLRTDLVFDEVFESSVAWADMDNDADLDIIISGNSPTGRITKIFNNRLNEGSGFEERTDVSITGFDFGDMSVEDMDGDGDLDILLSGNTDAGSAASIYENTLGVSNSFELRTEFFFEPAIFSSTDWADVDNDGDPDVVILGRDSNGNRITDIYENRFNEGEQFNFRWDLQITGLDEGDAKFGDLDGDGDLDLMLAGSDGTVPRSMLFENRIGQANLGPATPTTLTTSLTSENISFGWTANTDDTTPQDALSYEVFMAEETTGNIVRYISSDTTSGYRMVSQKGSINSTAWNLNTPVAGTYRWGVQAIDAGRIASQFATEILTVPDTIAVTINEENSNNSIDVLVKGDVDKVLAGFEVDNSIFIDLGFTVNYSLESIDVDIDNPSLIASLRLFNSDDNVFDASADREVAAATVNGNTFTFATPDAITATTTYYYVVANIQSDAGSGTFNISIDPDDIDLSWSNEEILVPLTSADPLSSDLYHVNSNRYQVKPSIAIGVLDNQREAWGDFDNDGDLDLAVTGTSGGSPVTRIYTNTIDVDDQFSLHTQLTTSGGVSVSWGDMDGDGDLDLLVGNSAGNNSTIIENIDAGTSFNESTISINQKATSSDWGDFDNDGDLDIVISGHDGSNTITRIYENQLRNENSFIERTDLNLLDVDGYVSFGDLDNDGDLDLFVSGTGSIGGGLTNNQAGLLENRLSEGSGFIELGSTVINLNSDYSSGDWGDMDGDGDLDLLVVAISESGATSVKIFDNNFSVSSDFNERTDFNIFQDGYPFGNAWADIDNDGDLDFAFRQSTFTGIRFYENKLATSEGFEERVDLRFVFTAISGDESGSMHMADFDGDSDMDYILNGNNSPNIYAFENIVNLVNAAPAAPGSLSSTIDELDVSLSWSVPSDDTTPAEGLTFEVYIGTESNVENIRPAQSNIPGGIRKIVQTGSVLNNTLDLTLPIGSYRWSVQAIDANGSGSQFASQEVLLIPDDNPPVISNLSFNNVVDNSADLVVTATVIDDVALGTGQLNFGPVNQTMSSSVDMIATGNENEFSGTIPASSLALTGVSFFIEFDDLFDNTGRSDTTSLAFTITNEVSISGQVNFFGSNVVDYEMIALPFESQSSSIVFEDLGPYDKKVWRLFSWNAGSQQYSEQPSTIRPGSGYWILAKDQVSVNVTNVRPVTTNPFTAPVSSDWNLLGNPYDKAINLADLIQHNVNKGRLAQASDVQFAAFSNGNWSTPSTWNAYQGLFLFYSGATATTIEIPAFINLGGGRTGAKDRNYVSEQEWQMEIGISSGRYTNNINGIGVHPQASVGEDNRDLRNPPMLWEAPVMRFTGEDGIAGNLARSIIPYNEEMSWNFVVTAEKGTEITLNWEIPGNLDHDLIVIDHGQLIPISMSTTNSITFQSRGTNTFTVSYGDISDFDLGDQTLIGQIYPNPVSINFKLPVYMSVDGEVALKLYSLNGTRIELGRKEYLNKGYHIISNEDLMGQLQPGIYVLETLIDGGRTAHNHQSIIIQN